jgi:ketosteroid isomerase-like protein
MLFGIVTLLALELFAKYFELTDSTFRVEVHDLLASDDHPVVLGKVYGERKGRSIPEDYVQVSHFKNGRVSESWIVAVDQKGTDEFFPRLARKGRFSRHGLI